MSKKIKQIKHTIIKPTKCPYCESEDVTFSPPKIRGKKKFHCNSCGNAFWG